VPLLVPLLCSPSEVLLDRRDDAGLCHKIGTYCSSSFLGICLTKRDVYCCFQSKISRILQGKRRFGPTLRGFIAAADVGAWMTRRLRAHWTPTLKRL
jgi:hypothetical protein